MKNRDQNVEIIVHSEVEEILGSGLGNDSEGKSSFTDRLGFLGHLLHRNNIFALIVSKDASLTDRNLIKENYKNCIQVGSSLQSASTQESLCDITIDEKDDLKNSAKKIIEYLIKEKLIPEASQQVYSKEEEEEIRRRLEELGYV